MMNKYNFLLNGSNLTLTYKNKKILSINSNELGECELISSKILELENSLKESIVLMQNKNFLFLIHQYLIKLS